MAFTTAQKGKASHVNRQKINDELQLEVACTKTLFYFSFRSFGKHRRARKRGEHASEASEREKEFFFPTPTPLRWLSINPPTDFEVKIEGL